MSEAKATAVTTMTITREEAVQWTHQCEAVRDIIYWLGASLFFGVVCGIIMLATAHTWATDGSFFWNAWLAAAFTLLVCCAIGTIMMHCLEQKINVPRQSLQEKTDAWPGNILVLTGKAGPVPELEGVDPASEETIFTQADGRERWEKDNLLCANTGPRFIGGDQK